MQLEYLDGDLRRLAADPAFSPEGWSGDEIRHFLFVAQCAEAATCESDLFNLRILRLRRDPEGSTAWVLLSPQRRLVITFRATSDAPAIALLDLSTTERT